MSDSYNFPTGLIAAMRSRFGILRTPLIAAFCIALSSATLAQQPDPEDPWEGMNRKLYAFNDTLDKAAIRPAAVGYKKVVPLFVRTGVTNFFNNLDDVNVVVNDVLQLKFNQAFHDSGRFLLNTTVGLGGVIDVASEVGLQKNYEDFGQTLGYWGVGSGPYVVIPFIGNSTLRDTVGMVPDAIFNPIFWVEDRNTRFGTYALERLDTRVYFLLADDLMQGDDDYAYAREALLQRREFLVNDGVVRDQENEFDF